MSGSQVAVDDSGRPHPDLLHAAGRVHARSLFDGWEFIHDGVVEIADGRIVSVEAPAPPSVVAATDATLPCLLPGLVDAGVRFRGYRETAVDPPFAAVDAIIQLLSKHAVAGVKERGNSREALAYALHVAEPCPVAVSGPVLVSGVPQHEVECPVPTPALASAAVASNARDGTPWVMLGQGLTPVGAAAACETAAEHGVAVAAVPGLSSPTLLADSGACCLHAASSLMSESVPWRSDRRPAEVAADWSAASEGLLEEMLVPRLLERDVALAPELVAFRRSVFIREVIELSGLEDLVPIFPSTRWLLEMRRAGGFLLGRRQLTAATGLTDLGREERRQAAAGYERLLEFVRAAASAGVPIVASSHAPSFGVVPGRGLMEELAVLACDVGLGVRGALRAATGVASDVIGLDALGRIESGAPAVLACAGDPSLPAREFFGSVRPLVAEDVRPTANETPHSGDLPSTPG